jgi:hypothetical protein
MVMRVVGMASIAGGGGGGGKPEKCQELDGIHHPKVCFAANLIILSMYQKLRKSRWYPELGEEREKLSSFLVSGCGTRHDSASSRLYMR